MESKIHVYERKTIEQLLDAGFYIKKQYGNIIFGISKTKKDGCSVFTEDASMFLPRTVSAFSDMQFKIRDMDNDLKDSFEYAAEVIKMGLQEAGEFDRFAAESQAPCKNCFYGMKCDSSCPFLADLEVF